MPSTFGSLNIALRGLLTMQRAIEISGHNVTNASSPGYSRQSPLFAATPPDSFPAVNRNASFGQVGTGVMVKMVQRYRSAYLDSQIRTENMYLNSWSVRRDVLQQIEVIFNEPSDSSFNQNLGAFWSAWQDLAAMPESTAARAHVAETADNLSTRLREMRTQLTDLQVELDHRVDTQVARINDLATQIAALNEQINAVRASGQQPNDLLDQRERLLKELTGMINVDAFESETGSLMISLGGRLLVMDYTTASLAVEHDPTNHTLNRVVWADTGATVQVAGIPLAGGLTSAAADRLSGQMGATLVARDLIVPARMAELDAMAAALIETVNALHATGYGLNSVPGGGLVAMQTVPGTVNGFSLTTPGSGLSTLASGTYFVEIRDNSNVLEFRLVDSDGNAIDIYDASAGGGAVTSAWQPLSLVSGMAFDTGRGLVVNFAPVADHSLGMTSTDANVSGFNLSGVASGLAELPSGTYHVEVRNNGGDWQFRLVDAGGAAVAIYDNSAGDGSLTSDWQSLQSVPHSFDTRRGLTIQFSGGPYEETTFGGTPSPANVEYTARGTQVGGRLDGAASATLGAFFDGSSARDIALSNYIKADFTRIATAAAPDSPGDGSVALAIARLAQQKVMNGGATSVGDYYRSIIAALGKDARHALVTADHHDLLTNHLEERQEELAGVSLDEETVNLVQFQRTYQAAARVMTTMDEMLDKIINGMGLVGR